MPFGGGLGYSGLRRHRPQTDTTICIYVDIRMTNESTRTSAKAGHPDPDYFRNLVKTSLSKDTFVIKYFMKMRSVSPEA